MTKLSTAAQTAEARKLILPFVAGVQGPGNNPPGTSEQRETYKNPQTSQWTVVEGTLLAKSWRGSWAGQGNGCATPLSYLHLTGQGFYTRNAWQQKGLMCHWLLSPVTVHPGSPGPGVSNLGLTLLR